MVFKKTIYLATIFYRIFLFFLNPNKWPWWNQINENIILGAIPLRNKGHDDFLIRSLEISSVLSILEEFEWENKGTFSIPVKPEDWSRRKIPHLQIRSPDFSSINLSDIDVGVEFLRRQALENRTTYVHCKAGKGRSAMVVICYLMKERFMLPDEAFRFVKGKRPLISPNKSQIKDIRRYHSIYC